MVRHRPPRVVLRRGLREPDVARVAGELPALERARRPRRGRRSFRAPCSRGTRRASSSPISSSSNRCSVSGCSGALIVTTSQTRTSDSASSWNVSAELLLDVRGQAVPVGVVQLDVERLQPAQHRGADAPRGDRADLHALEVVRARDAVGDVPAAVDDPLVRRDVVADERRGSSSRRARRR